MNTATEKQITLIRKLATERVIADLNLDGRPVDSYTTREASELIDRLFACPRVTSAAAAAPAGPGFYLRDGQVIRIQKTKDGQRTYAKRLVIAPGERKGSWEYAPGVCASLAGMEPLSVAAAAKLGHAHGVCMVCGRELTDPKSVEAGIGPVCASRLDQ